MQCIVNKTDRRRPTLLLVAILLFVGAVVPVAAASPGTGSSVPNTLALPNLDDFVVFSTPGNPIVVATAGSQLWPERPRHALNDDGQIGFFSAATADRIAWGRILVGLRYKFRTLGSRFGAAFANGDEGFVHTYQVGVNYLGQWAEWSALLPVHEYALSAPRTYGTPSHSETGLGDMKLGLKFTYLPDKSYYRWAYGAVVSATTGNADKMRPAGPKDDGELKLFGAVTTRETDNATLNVELGAVLTAKGDANRALYRFGLAYEAGQYTSLIGEFAGEVLTGDDKDSLDMVIGMRVTPSSTFVMELSYTKMLRTYREYGYDDEWSFGVTERW